MVSRIGHFFKSINKSILNTYAVVYINTAMKYFFHVFECKVFRYFRRIQLFVWSIDYSSIYYIIYPRSENSKKFQKNRIV